MYMILCERTLDIMKKIIALTALVMAAVLLFCACGNKAADENETTDIMTLYTSRSYEDAPSDGNHTKVLFTMESGDTFTIELYPEVAPDTCKNFEKLVKESFYDGLTFHRVISNFMAQGGDGSTAGKTAESIFGEFANNGFNQNNLSHKRGVVSMARQGNNMDSASSQFFICYTDCSYLDGNYAAFGKVIDGMETVDAFLEIERTMAADGNLSVPVTPIVIQSAVILEEGK